MIVEVGGSGGLEAVTWIHIWELSNRIQENEVRGKETREKIIG